jgi:hypothetical protein
MKTITTHTGETFTLDFFCEARRAHMTFIGCERMQVAAQKAAAKKHHLSPGTVQPAEENPCLGCAQGAAIRRQNHKKTASGPDAPPADPRCLWPGCTAKPHACGLCVKHHRQWKRNALVKLNTASAGPGAARHFLARLAQMTKDAGMPVEDVALAALDEGIKMYFERLERSSKLKAQSKEAQS